MTFRPSLGVALLGLCLASLPATAQDLFAPVTGAEEASVRAKNTRYLAERLYVAKRHRIVRVNGDVLRSGEGRPLLLNLFNDVQVSYVITSPLAVEPAAVDRVTPI